MNEVQGTVCTEESTDEVVIQDPCQTDSTIQLLPGNMDAATTKQDDNGDQEASCSWICIEDSALTMGEKIEVEASIP